jgi:hypothetical protein
MARAGEGAGDQLMALNIAHAWASHYNTKVELEYHWNRPEDYKWVESDPERMAERTDRMHSKLLYPETVEVIHLWGSDLFDYHGTYSMGEEGLHLRREISYKRWLFPRKPDASYISNQVPFAKQLGSAEWTFSEKPTQSKTIAFWDYSLNKELPNSNKVPREYLWEEIRAQLSESFPEHRIVNLTYRDTFEEAYSVIRDCEFCVGYDGMWHRVARNFGKLFITHTLMMDYSHRNTNPVCSTFNSRQILGYIESLGKNEDYLMREKNLASRHHEFRMEFYDL